MSLPTRERGLKLSESDYSSDNSESLPTRERGLKLENAKNELFPQLVAPHAGAWIETRSNMQARSENIGRSPRGSVD